MKDVDIKKVIIETLEEEQECEEANHLQTLENDWSAHLPRLRLPSLSIDQLPTHSSLRAISSEFSRQEFDIDERQAMSDMPTWILPVVPVGSIKNLAKGSPKAVVSGIEDQVSVLRKLVQSSGVYALSSMVSPLISLVLAPFLTHNLSPSDYGILTILNAVLSLSVGVTQMGLSTAFFRAYNYDYTEDGDRRNVVATTTTILFVISTLTAIGAISAAPLLANLLLGSSSLSGLIIITASILLVQNLTVPGFAWLRAENRAFFYSLLSISNLLISLLANIVLVGLLHLGVSGSLIATSGGYISVVICTVPIIIFRAGIKIRADIARNLLSFGVPLILNYVSYWVLQLSDRYLLSRFSSFSETAKYAVVYSLGSAISVVVMSPFTLAWPTTMFAVAKRKDATQIFRLIFRWLSLFLLFAAFALSLVGALLLNWLFPVTYHSGVFIIPIVALSLAFYGVYFIFMIGVNVQRKTWMAGIFTTVAAIVNLIMNLFLIPQYGAMGAAISTLIAYIVLALIAYIVNQRMYPVSFEIGRFIVGLLLGSILYSGSNFVARSQGIYEMYGIYVGALVLYGGCLAILGKLPSWHHKSGAD
jgi:O-antigen/teichoic acid export membrane protein